jgi:hypothetical protein
LSFYSLCINKVKMYGLAQRFVNIWGQNKQHGEMLQIYRIANKNINLFENYVLRPVLLWPRRDIIKYILHFHVSAFSTFAFPCFHIFIFSHFHVSAFSYFHVSVFSYFRIFMFLYFHIFVFSYFRIFMFSYFVLL